MELIIIPLLILVNGLFAMSEMAVVSSRKARLQQFADESRPGSRAALSLANESTIFLSTVQVGMTIIGITSGAFGEATLSKSLSHWLSQWPLFDGYSDAIALTIVVAGITLSSLLFGELIPKRIALLNPERIASIVARPMQIISSIAFPVVKVLSWVTEGTLKVLRLEQSDTPPVTQEEINVLMEQGAEAGVFEEHQQELVARALRLDQMRVSSIMTARADLICLDLEDSLSENTRKIAEHSHSRFPVVRGGLDQVEGIVLARNLLTDCLAGKSLDIGAQIFKPLFIPETVSAMSAVELFKKHRETAALVMSEHGEIHGMVTLNDVMEALVGDIATVEDEADRDIVKRSDTSWLIEGSVALERLSIELNLKGLDTEENDGFKTVGGFVMHRLGRLPAVTDRFDWRDWQFEVIDMDQRRVDKVLLSRGTNSNREPDRVH